VRSNTETRSDFEPRMDLTTSLSVLLPSPPPLSLSLSLSLSLLLRAHTRAHTETGQGTLPACAFHARFLRSILDRAESTEANERDSIAPEFCGPCRLVCVPVRARKETTIAFRLDPPSDWRKPYSIQARSFRRTARVLFRFSSRGRRVLPGRGENQHVRAVSPFLARSTRENR
jgi:hypothetical protein